MTTAEPKKAESAVGLEARRTYSRQDGCSLFRGTAEMNVALLTDDGFPRKPRCSLPNQISIKPTVFRKKKRQIPADIYRRNCESRLASVRTHDRPAVCPSSCPAQTTGSCGFPSQWPF